MFIQMYNEKFMRFPGGKCKAATFSYDDGVAADKRLIKIFDKYGVKGTFNLNNLLFDAQCWNNRMNEEDVYATFKDCGHEIALHGARHIFLNKVPLTEAVNEVLQNRLYLESKFGTIVRGMAYAYDGYNDDIVGAISALGVKYARTTEASLSFSIPQDWLRLKPTCHHDDRSLPALAEKFVSSSPCDSVKEREPWLLFVWGHSYEFDRNNNWDRIEDLCKKLSGDSGVWFATNGEVYDYVQAYNSLVWSADGERAFNPSYMAVYVEIRGKVYEIPAGKEVVFDK